MIYWYQQYQKKRGERVKSIQELRKEKGYTQLQMAQKMGIGLSTYQQKEQGHINWGVKDLIKIRTLGYLDGDADQGGSGATTTGKNPQEEV